jgi:hypothetical protein
MKEFLQERLERLSRLGEKRGLRGFMIASPVVALLGVLVFAISGHFATGSTAASVFAVGAGVVGGATFAGVLLGFLFGLPKTVERHDHQGSLSTNTNLDQISDWLTKILVGLGLVQLGKVSHGVSGIGASLAPGLGGGPGAKAFGVGVLMYSLIDGFLIGYIWTRIDLSPRFKAAADELGALAKVMSDQVLLEPLPKLPPSPGSADEPPDSPNDGES